MARAQPVRAARSHRGPCRRVPDLSHSPRPAESSELLRVDAPHLRADAYPLSRAARYQPRGMAQSRRGLIWLPDARAHLGAVDIVGGWRSARSAPAAGVRHDRRRVCNSGTQQAAVLQRAVHSAARDVSGGGGRKDDSRPQPVSTFLTSLLSGCRSHTSDALLRRESQGDGPGRQAGLQRRVEAARRCRGARRQHDGLPNLLVRLRGTPLLLVGAACLLEAPATGPVDWGRHGHDAPRPLHPR